MAVVVGGSVVVVMVVVVLMTSTTLVVIVIVIVIAEDRAIGGPEMAHRATVAGGVSRASESRGGACRKAGRALVRAPASGGEAGGGCANQVGFSGSEPDSAVRGAVRRR